MKLILTAEVDHLGDAGDAVEVKDGYGRNYLLPRGLAIVATRGAQKQADEIRRAREAKTVHDREHADEIKAAITALGPVSLTVKTAGDAGKLFGSVKPVEIINAVSSQLGIQLDRHALRIENTIKSLGAHEVEVHLHPEINATLKLDVVASA